MTRPFDVPRRQRSYPKPILITGGAGFIGSNLADSLLSDGEEVIVFDDLSRPGVAGNLEWLRLRHGERVRFRKADLRDDSALAEAANQAGAVIHLAAQVAVTDSIADPREDFSVNAMGTVNLLEALRRKAEPTPLVFASTNKVYGALEDLGLEALNDRYQPTDPDIRMHGLDERRALRFCTPYSCSKGAADQYVLDYAKTFGLPAAVLRMSCIYGPRQFGTEDQGWVAHFLISALKGQPITIFGDGRQVRDVLHVRDAVRAYRLLLENAERLAGEAFNLGGGPQNDVSLITMLDAVERMLGRPVERRHAPMRAGDQLYYVADTRKLTLATGWRMEIGWQDGLGDLRRWLREGHSAVAAQPAPAPLRTGTIGVAAAAGGDAACRA